MKEEKEMNTSGEVGTEPSGQSTESPLPAQSRGYRGISTRETRLAELLEEVRRTYTMRLGQGSLASRICEALDAKCGIYTQQSGEDGINPCVLPAGHYGQCSALSGELAPQ